MIDENHLNNTKIKITFKAIDNSKYRQQHQTNPPHADQIFTKVKYIEKNYTSPILHPLRIIDVPDPPPLSVVTTGAWVVTGALVGGAFVGGAFVEGALVGAAVGESVTGLLVEGGLTGPPPLASSRVFFIREIKGYLPSPQMVPVKSSRGSDQVMAPP